MNNKQYRLREILNPSNGRSMVVDTSNGLVLGALPGLDDFESAVQRVLPLVDGIVTGPGQSQRLGKRTRQEAALIVRADWTNALRGKDFVLPPEMIQYIPILDAADALELGANGLVMHFLLGHEEAIEAACLKRVVTLAMEGLKLGMPLLVDVQPIGPRVVLREKAIELGVSYAVEGGADGVIVPWPGEDSMKTILAMCIETPVWVRLAGCKPDSPELVQALELGAAGIWIDESIFTLADPAAFLTSLRSMMNAAGSNPR
jgi:DhnA family fructose-bisphosphate aldolase class Ia